jgi:hypothetical protein
MRAALRLAVVSPASGAWWSRGLRGVTFGGVTLSVAAAAGSAVLAAAGAGLPLVVGVAAVAVGALAAPFSRQVGVHEAARPAPAESDEAVVEGFADQLIELEDRGWIVRPGLSGAAAGLVDLFIAGPAGAYAVVASRDGHKARELDRIRENVGRASEDLGFPIEPVACAVAFEGLPRSARGVWCVPVASLTPWLRFRGHAAESPWESLEPAAEPSLVPAVAV